MTDRDTRMNCAKARRGIHAEIDGELSTDARARLDAHLCACEACRTMRSELQAIHSAVRRLAAATDTTTTKPAPAIPFMPCGPRRTALAAAAWALATAAVLVLCVGGWLARSHLHAPAKPQAIAVRPHEAPSTTVAHDEPRHETPGHAPQVTLEAPPDTIVVSYPTRNPNVTIFWLYRTDSGIDGTEPAACDIDRPM